MDENKFWKKRYHNVFGNNIDYLISNRFYDENNWKENFRHMYYSKKMKRNLKYQNLENTNSFSKT